MTHPSYFVGLYKSGRWETLVKGDSDVDQWYFPVGVIANTWPCCFPGPKSILTTTEYYLYAKKEC